MPQLEVTFSVVSAIFSRAVGMTGSSILVNLRPMPSGNSPALGAVFRGIVISTTKLNSSNFT